MPASHFIDHEAKLIVTKWEGEATNTYFEDALRNYLENVRSSDECINYNEIVDIRKADPIKITIKGLLKIGQVATSNNAKENNMRMALLLKPGNSFSLARLYIFYRNMGRTDRKKISVFMNEVEAFEWAKNNN